MAHEEHGEDIIIALLASANADAGIDAMLGSKTATWAQDAINEPAYPVDPINDLPSLTLRTYTIPITAGPTANQTSFRIDASFWYKKLQAVGQQHHQLMVQDLETIANWLLANWRPDEIVAALDGTGTSLHSIFIKEKIVRDTLRHEFDDPRLRVSVGQVHFEIIYRTIGLRA